MAHELNNPISFVLGNVHAMQRYATRLKCFSAADRCENVEFKLTEIIQRSVLWVTRATPPTFQVDMQLPEVLPAIGSPGQMQQVNINLVQNAVDATENQLAPALTIQAWIENCEIKKSSKIVVVFS
ncbi:MAG: hypothetical protein ABL885_07970 [Methylophilaceae bacterium]